VVENRWDNFWKSSPTQVDRLWLVGLLLVALLLYSINLGGVALRDWDEGTVAQVAREISRSEPGALKWLYPTISGIPYLNKPPLIHGLIAFSYWLGGVHEWTSRLPGALLTATSVPLLYGVGRELFPRRTPAVFAALVYLTLLPVVRHGRLAMLDGAILCFFLLMLLCLLRTRRDLRWGLGIGLAYGLLWLTKGIVALPLGAIALLFTLLDTPRLLRSVYVWMGLLLGLVPVAAWYLAQWLHYGQAFINIGLFNQAINRVWMPVEANTGPPWYYLLEILKYSFPWILFLPWGIRLAWQNRNLGWAKMALIWAGGYLLIISLMRTKLPWYVLPVYPPIALMVGAYLGTLWNPVDMLGGWRQPRQKWKFWGTASFALAAIAGWVATLYFSPLGANPHPALPPILSAVAFTATVTAFLIACNDSQFIPILVWGSYLSLLMLMGSGQWLWELNESYPVKPVAQMVLQHTPARVPIATSYPNSRPSLNFYSDRPVIPLPPNLIPLYWQKTPQPYLLTNQATLDQLQLYPVRQLGQADEWLLVSK
jgi:4-amino-4-deoxy-L-arabinose transferase-like glycosyltransferase